MGFNYIKATEPLQGDSLLFTTQSPGLPVVDLGRMKGFEPRTPGFPYPLDLCLFRLTHLLFICEQTLFNFSNIQLEQQIHFLHNPFFIHPPIRNATLLFEKLSKMKAFY